MSEFAAYAKPRTIGGRRPDLADGQDKNGLNADAGHPGIPWPTSLMGRCANAEGAEPGQL